jgi:hypothetical protein
MKGSSLEADFLLYLPDEVLVELAIYNWEELKILCAALSLDLYLKEQNESTSNRRNLC